MIAVIADDFTGAAELAGISLRYGLQVKLYTGPALYEESDVCIVSGDSRSMSKEAAIDATREIITALLQQQPLFIYKKIDSVLRGYVLDELRAQMELTKKKKAIIIPANPSLGRKIISGKYYIEDRIITDTDFSSDPEFPVRSANVKEMLGDKTNAVSILSKITNEKDEEIIAVGETSSQADINYWINVTDNNWTMAGAGDFFESLLAASFSRHEHGKEEQALPHLYICGTTSNKSREFISLVDQASNCVIYLQEEQLLRQSPLFSPAQLDQVKNIVSEKKKLALVIAELLPVSPLQLRTAVARVVKQLTETIEFREIFIEGGATAAAILERLDLRSFLVTNELQRGVVRMKAAHFFITVKPGSYPIPEQVRDLYLININQ